MFSTSVFAEREAKTPTELRLLEAVSKDSIEVVNRLINKGVSAKLTDEYGQSLLMFAAENNNKELVKLLKAKGANSNYKIEPTVSYNEGRNNVRMLFLVRKTVLDFGVMTNDTTMVELLMDLGAKLDIQNKDLGSTVANASKENNVDMVRYLLRKGANVSKETGQLLVLWHIQIFADPIYTSVDKNADFRIIKIWDNYGIPLDDGILKSSILKSDRDKNRASNYLAAYKVWLDNGAIEPKQKKREQYSNPIPNTSNEQKFDSIQKQIHQRQADEKALIKQKQEKQESKAITYKWGFFFICASIIVVSIVYRTQISFYSKKLYDKFKQTAFYNRLIAAMNPPVQPHHNQDLNHLGAL